LQILERVLPERLHGRLAYLSGPSFAAEVAAGMPTVVTIASRDEAVAQRAQTVLSSPRFRCYRTTDVAGIGLVVPAPMPRRLMMKTCDQLQICIKHPFL